MNLYTAFFASSTGQAADLGHFHPMGGHRCAGQLVIGHKKTVFTVLLFPSQKTLFKADGASSLISV